MRVYLVLRAPYFVKEIKALLEELICPSLPFPLLLPQEDTASDPFRMQKQGTMFEGENRLCQTHKDPFKYTVLLF